MKQTEKKGPAVQAAAVAEAKRKWEGAEALKIINCADGFRQVNDMSGADFAKAFRKVGGCLCGGTCVAVKY